MGEGGWALESAPVCPLSQGHSHHTPRKPSPSPVRGRGVQRQVMLRLSMATVLASDSCRGSRGSCRLRPHVENPESRNSNPPFAPGGYSEGHLDLCCGFRVLPALVLGWQSVPGGTPSCVQLLVLQRLLHASPVTRLYPSISPELRQSSHTAFPAWSDQKRMPCPGPGPPGSHRDFPPLPFASQSLKGTVKVPPVCEQSPGESGSGFLSSLSITHEVEEWILSVQ